MQNQATRESASVVAPFAPGTLLQGRYRLLKVLGSGAHGVTFRAHHEFLNHPCVVKVLPARIDNPSDAEVSRFRSEAAAGFRVNHPNVVRVLDGDADGDVWYFVMEYVEGVDLSIPAANGLRLDWRQVLKIAVDVAAGLQAIHDAGLLHLDVKPANLILGGDGLVRLTDFGVARFCRACPEFSSAAQERPDATLAYAAPELLSGGLGLGPQADLYALGASLCELLSGRTPGSRSVYQTVLAKDKPNCMDARLLPDDLPDWFLSALRKLTAPDPRERFSSAESFLEHVRHPAPARRSSEVVPARLPQPRGLVVLPFADRSADRSEQWLGHSIADHISAALAQLPGAFVVDVDQFMQTHARIARRGTLSENQQLREAGRLSGAASIVRGEFLRTREQIELSAEIVSVGKADVIGIPLTSGALATLAHLEAALVQQIAERLGLGRTPPPAYHHPAHDKLAAEERFFRARHAFLNGDYDTALQLGREALELDPDYGDALGFVGACCARLGNYQQAAEYQDRLLRLAARLGDERLKVQALANMGAMHYFRGEYAAANERLSQAAQAAETLRLTTELAPIYNNLGFVLLQTRQIESAGRTFGRAVELFRSFGALVSLIGPYNGLGHVRREQQRYEEAREFFHRALTLAQESDDAVNMGITFMNLGHCALLQGRLADAKHELAVALNILEKTSFWNGLARVYEYMTDLNTRLGNLLQAVQCADRRIQLARRHDNRHMEQDARRQKARALRAARQARGVLDRATWLRLRRHSEVETETESPTEARPASERPTARS